MIWRLLSWSCSGEVLRTGVCGMTAIGQERSCADRSKKASVPQPAIRRRDTNPRSAFGVPSAGHGVRYVRLRLRGRELIRANVGKEKARHRAGPFLR